MKSISRDEVLRWVSGPKSQGGSGAGGGSVDLAGYATQIWTEQNYVGKEFFSSLFKAYDANGNEVLPNDTDTQIDNIKAMFGFWTEFYVSALGTGGQSTVGLRLAQLADVNVAGVTNGQVLTYDTTSGKWIASTPQSGTDMATVWANLAASGNQQINYSHLSGAVSLSGNTITIGGSTITPAVGSFLPLSGGTMTGPITMKANQYGSNYGLNINNSDIINVNAIKTADLSDTWDEGFLFARTNGNWDSFRASDGDFYMNNNSGNDSACLHVSRLVLSSTNDAQGTAWNSPALCVGGSYSGAHIEIDSNEIMAKSNASTTTTLYLNAEGGNCVINETAGNCGIGTGSPAHKLHVNGGIYSTSYVTALSDARHKTIINDAAISVEQIAKMPAVVYRWNDGRKDDSLHVGSIAQDWQRILPEVVLRANDKEGTLSMQYGVAALVSSIITARKVVDHERRIAELERENKELKMKLKIA